MTLLELAKKYNTDKAAHGFIPVYERLFRRFSGEVSLLEVGVYHGASLRMWADYFPKGRISGVDVINRVGSFDSPRIKVFEGSQADAAFLKTVFVDAGPFDIVIDDGSHGAVDTVSCFKQAFSMLKPGGIYVIEDTLCSYWSDFGGGLKKPGTIVEFCKDLVDFVNVSGFRTSGWSNNFSVIKAEKGKLNEYEDTILSVSFFVGLIAVEKRYA